MQTVLDTAHTWFFESLEQGLGGALTIRLTEGIKGVDRLPVQVGDKTLGPYFPVTVEPHSRCALVHFPKALAFFSYNESFDTSDPHLVAEKGRSVVRDLQGSSFRAFSLSRTTIAALHTGPLHEYLIWTEDQIFQVLSGSEPEVGITDVGPDFGIERGHTWSAS